MTIHVEIPTFGQGITFYEGPTNQGSHGDWGACGPFALGVAMAAAKGIPFTGQWLDTIITRMQQGGHFTPNGGCAPSDLLWYLATYAKDMTYHVVPGIDFSGSQTSANNYHAAIIPALSAGKPCVSEWLNAQALVGNEQGVRVHYDAQGGIDSVLGYLHCNGNKVPDNIPNSPYWIGWGSMDLAQPCWLLIFDREGTTPDTIPNGWTDDGTTLMAFNKIPVTLGFRQFILADPTWDAADVPVATAFGRDPVTLAGNDGAGTIQYFYQSILAWTPSKGVFKVIDPGKEAYVGATRPLPPAPPAPTPPPPDLSGEIATLKAIQNTLQSQANSIGTVITALEGIK